MADTTTMTTKGQVTVPREICDRLGLKSGDKVAFTMLSDGTVLMRPKTRRLADLEGSLTRPGAAQGHRRGHEPVQGEDRDGGSEAAGAISIRPAARKAVRTTTRSVKLGP